MLPTPNKNMQLPKIQILRYSQLLNSPFSDMKLLNLDASFVCFNNLTANVKFMNHQVLIIYRSDSRYLLYSTLYF